MLAHTYGMVIEIRNVILFKESCHQGAITVHIPCEDQDIAVSVAFLTHQLMNLVASMTDFRLDSIMLPNHMSLNLIERLTQFLRGQPQVVFEGLS